MDGIGVFIYLYGRFFRHSEDVKMDESDPAYGDRLKMGEMESGGARINGEGFSIARRKVVICTIRKTLQLAGIGSA
jgi:hypothetical protein